MYHGGMRTQSSDTSPEAEQVQIALLRAAPVWRRLAGVSSLNRTLHTLALGGLRHRQPGYTAFEHRQLAALRLGTTLAARAYGPLVLGSERGEWNVEVANEILVLLLVTTQLEALDVPYALGGSMASAALGIYRATNDADIIADLTEPHVDPLVRALEGAFYIDADAIREAIRHRSSTNLIHLESMFKVDLFIPKRRAFDRNQLARRVSQQVTSEPPRDVYIASAEDTVLAKLEWYRMGGEISDRQWNDILGVLKVQALDIDLAYLRQWAPQLGVADLLARALDDAGLA